MWYIMHCSITMRVIYHMLSFLIWYIMLHTLISVLKSVIYHNTSLPKVLTSDISCPLIPNLIYHVVYLIPVLNSVIYHWTLIYHITSLRSQRPYTSDISHPHDLTQVIYHILLTLHKWYITSSCPIWILIYTSDISHSLVRFEIWYIPSPYINPLW